MSADWPLGGWGGGEGGRCGFFLSITSSCALRDPRRYRKTGCGRCEEEISAQRAREKGGRGMGSAPVSPSLARRTPKTSLVREREIEDSVGLPSGCGWMGTLGRNRRTISITYASLNLKGLFPQRERQKNRCYCICTVPVRRTYVRSKAPPCGYDVLTH